jgi:hypothetical protein
MSSRMNLYDCEDRFRRAVKECATSRKSLTERLRSVADDLCAIDPNVIPDRLRKRFDHVLSELTFLNRSVAATVPDQDWSCLISEIVHLWADIVQSVKIKATRWHGRTAEVGWLPIKKRPSSVEAYPRRAVAHGMISRALPKTLSDKAS